MKPTVEQFQCFENIFEHFNKSLFSSCLPSVILTFSRGKKYHGFFAPERWKKNGSAIHEIALNPETMNRDKILVCSTLVHEQVHLWQEVFGIKKPRKAYHNKEWGKRMVEIGLQPSSTGAPGGKETGQNMIHYIIAGGKFEKAFGELDKSNFLPFESVISFEMKKKAKKKNKIKYTCPECDLNVWGGKDLLLQCKSCEMELIPEQTEEED